MLYTFDFFDCNDQIDHFDIADLADDHEAERAARVALLRSSVAVGVTIWEGARRVTSIMRSGRRRSQFRWETPRCGPSSGSPLS